MYSAHLPIHVEILDAVKYFFQLEGMEIQATLGILKSLLPPESAFKHCSSAFFFLGYTKPELVTAAPQREKQVRVRVKFPEKPNQTCLRERECHGKGLALGTA